jgi:hypothetical protein
MRKFIIALVVLALFGLAPVANATGSNTSHGYFYKPGYGDKGPLPYTLYNTALDATDAIIYTAYTAAQALTTLMVTWAPFENQDILIPGCVYSSGTQFTIPGDFTAQFTTNTKVRFDLGSGVIKGSYVVSSSYAAPNTTVDIYDNILTSPLFGTWLTATRHGLFPYGPGYVIAQDYGSDQAALSVANGIALGAGKQLLIGRTYSVTSDMDLSGPVKFMPGAVISIASGVTLTVFGPVDAGPYPIFSCSGTGKVQFAPNFVGKTYPQWHGAVADCDPVTISGTDSTIPINASIKALSGSRGELVFAGNYRITAGMYISNGVNNSGLMIRGEGMTRIYQTTTAEAGDGFIVGTGVAVDRITIRDLELHSSSINEGDYREDAGDILKGNTEGINLGDTCTNCLVENVITTGFGSAGIWLGRSDTCDNNKIIKCTASKVAHGFGIGGLGHYLEIKDCIAYDNPYNGIDVNAHHAIITGNHCYNNGLSTGPLDTPARNGIYIGAGGGSNIAGYSDILIANNYCSNNGNSDLPGTGILVGAYSCAVFNTVVSGNVIADCNRGGIEVSGLNGGGSKYVTITGNSIYNCSTATATYKAAIETGNIAFNTVTGNTIIGDGTHGRGIQVGGGVGTEGNDGIISGNTITAFDHGLSLVGKRYIVTDNRISVCVTSGILCQSAGYGQDSIIKDNYITSCVTGVYLYPGTSGPPAVAPLAITIGKNYFTGNTTNVLDNNSNAYNYNMVREWQGQGFQNLVKNGNFRSWSAGTATYPDGWESSGHSPDSIAQTASPYYGYFSMASTYTSFGNVRQLVQLPQIEGRYTIGAYLKSSGCSPYIHAAKGTNNALEITLRTVPADGAWHWVQFTFDAPVGETSIYINVGNTVDDPVGIVSVCGVVMVQGDNIIAPDESPADAVKPVVAALPVDAEGSNGETRLYYSGGTTYILWKANGKWYRTSAGTALH